MKTNSLHSKRGDISCDYIMRKMIIYSILNSIFSLSLPAREHLVIGSWASLLRYTEVFIWPEENIFQLVIFIYITRFCWPLPVALTVSMLFIFHNSCIAREEIQATGGKVGLAGFISTSSWI